MPNLKKKCQPDGPDWIESNMIRHIKLIYWLKCYSLTVTPPRLVASHNIFLFNLSHDLLWMCSKKNAERYCMCLLPSPFPTRAQLFQGEKKRYFDCVIKWKRAGSVCTFAKFLPAENFIEFLNATCDIWFVKRCNFLYTSLYDEVSRHFAHSFCARIDL